MENFIVRIYRREIDDPDQITGVVEKPDSSESKRFSSVDDLIAILVPHAGRPKTRLRKQMVEQRKHRRFPVREGTLIFNTSTDVGEIIDISMGGLSFTAPEMPEVPSGSFDVGILFGEDENITGKVQCKKMMCHGIPEGSLFSSQEKGERYSVEFGELTPDQRLNLEHIIQNYTQSEL
ncbi:MAG: PilZ domain-containing protein [Desulfobulbales bacterium]|nr:PilZ domain-containing protein [Desulfobulbales bacterium]